jgi:hypothetical protein
MWNYNDELDDWLVGWMDKWMVLYIVCMHLVTGFSTYIFIFIYV